MVTIINNEVRSSEGKMLVRVDGPANQRPFSCGRVMPGESEADYMEVDSDFVAVREAIAAKIAEIAEYDTSPAVNSFTLGGRAMWLDNALRISITDSTRKERAAGLTVTTLWHEGRRYDLPIDHAERMLIALEVYAKQCFNVTAQHKAAVAALTSVAAVTAYDHTAGYPPRLEL